MEILIHRHVNDYNYSITLLLASSLVSLLGNHQLVNLLNCLINLLNCVFSQALDEGKAIRVVFCDISKAFDMVWHRGQIA